MNKKIVTLLLTACILFLNACKKDSDVFVPDPGQVTGPDTNWVNSITSSMPASIMKTNLLIDPYRDSFEVNANYATINTSLGLQCIFPPNCCIDNLGVAVTGKVQVEIYVIKKKGDMVRMDKPTTSDGRLLVSGGEIFINLLKNGQPITLAPSAKVYLRYIDYPVSTQMKLFYGEIINIERFNWNINHDTTNLLAAFNQGYEISTKRLHWINCDYFYDTTTSNRTKVQTELPPNFTNANTYVYLVFNDMRAVMGMYGEPSVKKFISSTVPTGKAVTIVVLSKQGNDFYLGKQTVTTALSSGVSVNQNVSITPLKTARADILSFLANL